MCVNKCDKIGEPPADFYEFYNLGLGDPIQVSSVHGHGTGDLLDAVFEYFPPETEDEEDSDVISVAVIGKPNAGKSSLINKIVGEERCIVSDIAGTTRDTIDTLIENSHGKFNFTDTAGIRRKSRVDDNIEKYSILRAKMAIERSDVCVIMIDAVEGFTEQDSKVAGLAHDVLVTLSIYAIFRITINNPFIAGILTVVGYSINDTIVVFDRIRENTKFFKRKQNEELIDTSVNQTLSRSLMTSLTTLIVMLPLFFMASSELRAFLIPLMIGVFVGTYSSIFLCSPLFYELTRKENLSKYAEQQEKAAKERRKNSKKRENEGIVK